MMMIGRSALDALRLSDQRQAVHARHLEIGDEQIVREGAHAIERGRAVGRGVHVVLRQRERLRQQVADAGLIVDHEHALPRVADRRRGRCGPFAAAAAAGTLAVEPRVDVALPEPPLPADANRGYFSSFNQAIDRAEVDLEVLKHLFGGEKYFVRWKIECQVPVILPPCLPMAVRERRVNSR